MLTLWNHLSAYWLSIFLNLVHLIWIQESLAFTERALHVWWYWASSLTGAKWSTTAKPQSSVTNKVFLYCLFRGTTNLIIWPVYILMGLCLFQKKTHHNMSFEVYYWACGSCAGSNFFVGVCWTTFCEVISFTLAMCGLLEIFLCGRLGLLSPKVTSGPFSFLWLFFSLHWLFQIFLCCCNINISFCLFYVTFLITKNVFLSKYGIKLVCNTFSKMLPAARTTKGSEIHKQVS